MDDLIINDGTSDRTYEPMPNQGKPGEAWWKDNASTMSNPRTLRIAIQKTKSSTGTDSVVVQFNRTDDDAEGLPHTCQVHEVLRLPREGVTEANLMGEHNCLSDLLGSTQLAALLNGLIPKKSV